MGGYLAAVGKQHKQWILLLSVLGTKKILSMEIHCYFVRLQNKSYTYSVLIITWTHLQGQIESLLRTTELLWPVVGFIPGHTSIHTDLQGQKDQEIKAAMQTHTAGM